MAHVDLRQDYVSLKTAIMAVSVIIVVMAVILGFFWNLNQQRQTQVISSYQAETQTFFDKNPGKIADLYSRVFDQCRVQFDTENTASQKDPYRGGYLSSVSCAPAISFLNQLNKEGLRDFSAVAFIRLNGNSIELIEASGDYGYSSNLPDAFFLNYQNRRETEQYFINRVTQPKWQSFLNYMEGKQVAIPIKQNDQVVGYILRGVIEQ